jgi:hypothetical protein
MLRSIPATGRTVTITNLGRASIGVAGTVIGPYKTKTISMRYIEGHPTHSTKLATLVTAGKAKVVFDSDALTATETQGLDSPVSAELRTVRDVFTNPVILDLNGIKTAFALAAVDTTYSGTGLNGAVGALPLDYARNITIRAITVGGEATEEHAVVVRGLDKFGQPLVETITVGAQGAGADNTTQGLYAFSSVTSIFVPADVSVAPGDYEIGFGDKLGLSKPLSQGGMLAEFMDNAIAVAGTVALSAVGQPFGTYLPNTAPEGTHDYVVIYIAG